MGNGAIGLRGLKCRCGREAFILHPSSGQPLCKKHFLRYLYKKVLREAASLGLLKCDKITVKVDEHNEAEAKLVLEALRDWAKRKSCPAPELGDTGIYPLSLEKVLYLMLKAFYELDEASYKLANPRLAKNPAYTLLPFEVAAFAKLRQMKPPKEYGKGPLWEIALDVATHQSTEAFSALKILDKLELLFPIV